MEAMPTAVNYADEVECSLRSLLPSTINTVRLSQKPDKLRVSP
ncbi:hypothetical protein COO91_04079 [Nostoc flagelliforme CCNUN1]|uniref:Uncharacterized protein n=1 Tax=Nostoc flagelliforme CCNUN1 TaxID=2038116 RepID=A0A2K8SRN7_9NOSO|nr:hypothetical protein COO91_04079 [Nostoc flagelliforme CCNUN1]